jgi:hypothetical protein
MAFHACFAILGAAGCASTDDGLYRFSDGWREARIERILQGADIEEPSLWSCTRHTSAEERSQRSYAVVVYRGTRHKRRYLVEIERQSSMAVGDAVYANTSKCVGAIAPARKPFP